MMQKRTNSYPFFSIMSITLNCENDIANTINSLKIQDFTNYEHIIKDGVSRDNTIQAIEENMEKNKTKLIQTFDTGIYNATNQACTNCTGEYIIPLFMGDTFLTHDALSIIYSYISKYNFPDLLYTDVISREKSWKNNNVDNLIRYPDKLSKNYLLRKMICSAGWIIKKKTLFEHNFFDERFFYSADYKFILDWLDLGLRIKHIPIPLFHYKGCGASSINKSTVNEEYSKIRAMHYRKGTLILYSFYKIILSLIISLWGFIRGKK